MEKEQKIKMFNFAILLALIVLLYCVVQQIFNIALVVLISAIIAKHLIKEKPTADEAD